MLARNPAARPTVRDLLLQARPDCFSPECQHFALLMVSHDLPCWLTTNTSVHRKPLLAQKPMRVSKHKPLHLKCCRWPAWAGRPRRARRSQRRLGRARAPTRGPRPPRPCWGRRSGRSCRSAHAGAQACSLGEARTQGARLPRQLLGCRAGRSSRSAQVGARACSGADLSVSCGGCPRAKCVHCSHSVACHSIRCIAAASPLRLQGYLCVQYQHHITRAHVPRTPGLRHTCSLHCRHAGGAALAAALHACECRHRGRMHQPGRLRFSHHLRRPKPSSKAGAACGDSSRAADT